VVNPNKKSDYHEILGFVNISRLCIAFYRSESQLLLSIEQQTKKREVEGRRYKLQHITNWFNLFIHMHKC
jgi:hypothetical protein